MIARSGCLIMKLLYAVLTLLFFLPEYALGSSVPETSKEMEETIEEIFEQFVQIKGALSYPANIAKYPLLKWGKELRFYIDDLPFNPLNQAAISALEEVSSITGINLIREGLPSEADLVIVISKKDNVDLRMDGRWGKFLKMRMKDNNPEALDGDPYGISVGVRVGGNRGTLKFIFSYIIYDENFISELENNKEIYSRISVWFSIFSTILPEYEESIMKSKGKFKCFTVTNKVFMKISYMSEFDEFVNGKVKHQDFRHLISQTYHKLNGEDHDLCNQS
jgi:hypothetical protein